MPENKTFDLANLRQEIDRIDENMHALLIERGQVIARVLETKRNSGDKGSAFRPGREAELMRRLAERNQGNWPLDTAENVWRVIVATSTYLQVPYTVHADLSGGDAAVRDSARFHFGFTVPYAPLANARAVIEAVDASGGDLGIIRLDQSAEAGPWWRSLEGAARPKIITRLPFVERPGHPAGLPVFVIAKPLQEGAVNDETVLSVGAERWRPAIRQALDNAGARLEASSGAENGLALLVSASSPRDRDSILREFAKAGIQARIETIGGHAARHAAKQP